MEMKLKITIAGCGPGSPDLIAPAVRKAVAGAGVLVGAGRLLDLFPESRARKIPVGADVTAVLDQMASCSGESVVVLASGDPGLCSIARPVLDRFGRADCEIIPGISSIQTAFARLGLDWTDAAIVDAHGSDPACPPDGLAGKSKIAVLHGRPGSLRWAADLARTCSGDKRIFLCENLTLDSERIREVAPEDLDRADISTLSIMLLIERELLAAGPAPGEEKASPAARTGKGGRPGGTLYGIGIGPGDPGLITVKGAALIGRCRHIFVPKAGNSSESLALAIAGRYIGKDSGIRELVFPMTEDRNELSACWSEAARSVLGILEKGEDACFLTLGDPLLYSTYIYLLRELRKLSPECAVVTVPGITSVSAAAAISGTAIGEGKGLVTIIPADDLDKLAEALESGGTVAVLKVGKRLPRILDLLEAHGAARRSVFVSRAGLEGQRVETDLEKLRTGGEDTGYLSVILVREKEEPR